MKNKIDYLLRFRYELLLLCLILLVSGEVFIPESFHELFRLVMRLLSIAVGLLFFVNQKPWVYVLGAFFLASMLEEGIQYFGDHDLRFPIGIGYMGYFLLLSAKVFQRIYKAKDVAREMLSAVFCGFIMLALIGSFLFMTIEVLEPNSFSNLGELTERYQNIQYFSFITTLTIGYGDIAPLTPIAKQMTILIGLIGNFYSVIVVGIVIGKYLQKR